MIKYYKHKIYNKASCYTGETLIIHNTGIQKGKMHGILTCHDVNLETHLSDDWDEITSDEYVALTGFDESVMRNYS